eukprot:scaffold16689_cov107-Cylindrotheca_fusiformis.AAC.3
MLRGRSPLFINQMSSIRIPATASTAWVAQANCGLFAFPSQCMAFYSNDHSVYLEGFGHGSGRGTLELGDEFMGLMT